MLLSGTWLQQVELLPDTLESGDLQNLTQDFVDIDGDIMVVGAAGDDVELTGGSTAADAGAVYVYTRNDQGTAGDTSDDTWDFGARLTASDAAAGDRFGHSVKIDGDVIVVGSPNDGTLGDVDLPNNAGSAYVFRLVGATWQEEAKLTAGDAADLDFFGIDAAIDADTIVVGASNDDDLGDFSGSAYVFHFDGSSWTQQAKLLAPGGAAFDLFGRHVAVEGDRAFVGAPNNDQVSGNEGAVYVFERTAGVWSYVQTLTANDAAAGFIFFGNDLAVDNGWLIVGASAFDQLGAGYVFAFDGSNWIEQAKLSAGDGAGADFAHQVDVSGDTIVIGARGDDDQGSSSGSAYVFELISGTWAQTQKLLASDGEAGDAFGFTTAIDGNTIVIGAPSDDFTLPDGSDLMDTGAVYVFDGATGVFTEQAQIVLAMDQHFGEKVAISGDIAVVGAPFDSDLGAETGAAYVYVRDDGGTPTILTDDVWTLSTRLIASDAGAGDRFGSSVSIDGDLIVIGSPNDDDGGSNAGSAYAFRFDGSAWSEEAKLTAPDGSTIDFFGFDVDVSGDSLLVGAPLDDSTEPGDVGFDATENTGSAYVFTFDGVAWSLEAQLTASDGDPLDLFGRKLALVGNTAVIASDHDDDDAIDAGAAYVFERSGTTWTQAQKFGAGDATTGNEFARSLDFDGQTIVLGAAGSGGAAYAFTHDGSVWSEQAKLTAAGTGNFGFDAVGVSGDTIIVGARGDDDLGDQAGAAFIFTRSGSIWTEDQKLTADDGAGGDSFGISVAIDANLSIVGASSHAHLGITPPSGSAYVFATEPVTNSAPNVDDQLFAVDENAANGTAIGTVVASDPDTGDTLTFIVTGGSGASAFSVDSSTGEITVADSAQLDFEMTASFDLTIQVEDSGGLTDTAIITIELLNLPTLQGLVYVDVNDNGEVDLGEQGIEGVTIELLDDQSNVVATDDTDSDGAYFFQDVQTGQYTLREVQPTGVTDGQDSLGTSDGVPTGDDSVNDQFTLTVARIDAINYNFGELGEGMQSGDTASIGFWQNKNGRSLIESLNGSAASTDLGDWLASNFPNMYASLAGASNSDVWQAFRDRFKVKRQKLDAQVMAVALAAYVTDVDLAGTAGAGYGFNVTDTGVATNIFNIGDNGQAFGVADNTDLTILAILQATNDQAVNGVLYDLDGDGETDDNLEKLLRNMANDVYSAINEAGDI